ncbi:MAG: hypothetical protein MRY32_09855 [Rickettsiales bacterium]|nr:hypothetical protein [Rickettsiales bacterium]
MCFVCVNQPYEQENKPDHIEVNATLGSEPYASLSYSDAADYTSAVLSGYTWADGAGQAATVTYTFDIADIDMSIVYADNLRGFNSAEQAVTLDLFEHIGTFTNLSFTEASDPGDAEITFYIGDIFAEYNAAGIANFYSFGTDFSHGTAGIDTSYSDFENPGGYDYQVLMHELGHVIGLKHTGQYSSHDSADVLPEAHDTWDNSVMSYHNGDEGYQTEYQEVDIAGLQELYGVASGFDSSTIDGSNDGGGDTNGDAVDSFDDDEAWMYGGVDTDDTVIILESYFGESYGGLGSDTITGSSNADTIYGGRAIADADDSADEIQGQEGSDLVYGNTGNDTIYGGFKDLSAEGGNDTIYGGLGEDSIYGQEGNDYLAGGGGVAHPNDDPDYIVAGSGNDSVVGNGGNDVIYLGTGDDTCWGGLDNDEIFGEDGDDYIVGQNGNDSMAGGSGSDTFFFYSDNDTDYIYGFSVGEDIIQLQANLNGSGISSGQDALDMVSFDGSSAVLNFGGDDIITIYTSTNLTADSFDIV